MKSSNHIDSATEHCHEGVNCCPGSEVLDGYAAGSIVVPAKLQDIESHLLTCHRCQKTLEEMDRFIGVLTKVGTTSLLPKPSSNTISNHVRLLASGVALVAVTAAILSIFIGPSNVQSKQDQPPVLLVSTRSSTAAEYLPAQALLLSVDSPDSITPHPFALILVSNDGFLLKQTQVQRSPVLSLPSGLPPGQYWIRLMTSESAAPLREFNFLVKSEFSQPHFVLCVHKYFQQIFDF